MQSERVYVGESMNESGTEYVRGDIVEQIRQQKRDAESALAELREEIMRLWEALTPSGDTKGAYIGEVKQPSHLDGFDDVTVSWTATKEIMALIRARAAEKAGKGSEP